jgi:hypothetical protein
MFVLREPSPREINYELLWGPLALGTLGAAWSWEFWRGLVDFTCPMKVLFEIPCVLCGGTRAMHALTHGSIGEAWTLNPLAAALGVFLLVYLVYCLAVAIRPGLKRVRVSPDARVIASPSGLLIRLAAVALLIGNWAYLIWAGR